MGDVQAWAVRVPYSMFAYRCVHNSGLWQSCSVRGVRLPGLGAQGVCKKGVCVCQPGFRGSYCEIAPTWAGFLDQAGNCCPTGLVSQNGTCCAAVSHPHNKQQAVFLKQSAPYPHIMVFLIIHRSR